MIEIYLTNLTHILHNRSVLSAFPHNLPQQLLEDLVHVEASLARAWVESRLGSLSQVGLHVWVRLVSCREDADVVGEIQTSGFLEFLLVPLLVKFVSYEYMRHWVPITHAHVIIDDLKPAFSIERRLRV